MARYGFVIDTAVCFGCNACAIACKVSKNLPNGVWYNTILTQGGATRDTAAGTYPNVSMRWFPQACQHCVNPACVSVCPTSASYVREDGVVDIRHEDCIGCQACVAACPYDARTYVAEAPEYDVGHALGDYDAPAHVAGRVEKCTMCSNRLDRGGKPACATACVNLARHWGDFDDPDSEVSQLLASGRERVRLLEEEGTEPSVYYLL